ncbi:class I SAM-dependent methyltransferase, partial [archaeon]|nr:class I SAM-dependent methyltransferase [archaeon]
MSKYKEIENYYNQTQILYDLVYSKGTHSLHYGYWYENTKNTKESILNNNKFIMESLDANSNDKILDAGCGIGGISLYLAKHTNAKIEGITLSEVQLKKARKLADKFKFSKNINFSIQDYTKTEYNDKSFTKIFGVESICYANKKIDFIKEAYRLLKKGGKLVVTDGFQIREYLNKKENKIYDDWLGGWGLTNLATVNSFQNDLKKIGFRKINYYDKLKDIKRTRNRIYNIGALAYVFSWILYKLGIFSNYMHKNTI